MFLLVIKDGTRRRQQTKENQFQSSMSETGGHWKILLPACLQFYLEIVFLQIKTAWSRLKLNFRRQNGLETKIARTFFGPLTFRAWIFRHCRPWSLKMSLASRRKGELHHSRHDHMLFKENSLIHVRKFCIFKLPLGHESASNWEHFCYVLSFG